MYVPEISENKPIQNPGKFVDGWSNTLINPSYEEEKILLDNRRRKYELPELEAMKRFMILIKFVKDPGGSTTWNSNNENCFTKIHFPVGEKEELIQDQKQPVNN